MVHFASAGVRRAESRPPRCRFWLPLLGFTTMGGVACHSSTSPTAATTGTLITTVMVPPGTTASVIVGGPPGSDYAVSVPVNSSGIDTLPLLSTGTYTFTDPTATASDPVVTPFYTGTVTGSPVTLGDADTARMGATFTRVPGSGHAWVGSTNGGSPLTAGYTSTELTTGTAPATTLSIAGPYQVLDINSNLWVADSASTTLAEYVPASLGASGTPSAAVTITSGALSGPVGMMFDRSGDLWISNANNNTIIEFAASQLAASGAVTPAVILSGAAIGNPGRIAFDAYGDLWVPNTALNTVIEFSPSQLGASGSPTPAVTLSAASASISGPRAVVFDEQGNLWVANSTGNSFAAFSNGQQTVSGSPAPFRILTAPASVGALAGFAFDNSGNLWGFGSGTASVFEYTAPQVVTGGASAPSFTTSVASNPVSLVFDPPPNGLPLVGPLTGRRKPMVTPLGRPLVKLR